MPEPNQDFAIQLPVLDLSKPLESIPLALLSQACREWGFFYVVNHGIHKKTLSQLSSLSKSIFTLPQDLKHKLGPSSDVKSYTPRFIASPYFESLRVSGPDFYVSAKSSSDELFGKQHSEFSDMSQEYGSKMMEISKKVREAVLKCLGDNCTQKLLELKFSLENGQLGSSEHRVILKNPMNRLSLAFFWCFEDEKVILAPDVVVGKGNSRAYKPFICMDYLKFRESNEVGRFERIGYTVNDFAGN